MKLSEQVGAVFKLAISNSSLSNCKLTKSIDFANNNISTSAVSFAS